jgi:uncharacterized membrane protein
VATVPEPLTQRRRIAPLFVVGAVLLVPWTFVLAVRLPARHTSQHWDIAWVGFDVALAVSLAATGWAIVRRSVWAPSAAAIAATLLFCDAWFDNMLASGSGERMEAAVEAGLVDIPLALICLWLARNSERSLKAKLAALERHRR